MLVQIMLTLLRHSISDYICSNAFIPVCKTGISSPFLHTHHFYTLSFSLSLSICVCACVSLSLSAHDDISCLHVLLLMMRGTLHNTSEAVTHDFMHDCFMILLDNALYDAYLIKARCGAHSLAVSTQLYTFLSIIAAMTLSHRIVTKYLRRNAT